MAALSLAACDDHDARTAAVAGGTPQEVAASIAAIRQTLDPAKEAEFAQAITTLTMVVPDRNDRASVGDMSPQFTRMVGGRSPDSIIQLAQLYRLSVPKDRP